MCTEVSEREALAAGGASGGWSHAETYNENVLISGLSVYLAGIAWTSSDGVVVTGSAANEKEIPVERARWELLERAATIEASRSENERFSTYDLSGRPIGTVSRQRVFPLTSDPTCWRYSLSNGVAVASTWSDACKRASWELTERDRVLRSWYGAAVPRRLMQVEFGSLMQLTSLYELLAFEFTSPAACSSSVVGIFAFPCVAGLPFACGYGCRTGLSEAVTSAREECLQVLGFLWGEPVPNAPPKPEPTPDFHQSYYLYQPHQDLLRQWLDEPRARAWCDPPTDSLEFEYVDLTPDWLAGAYVVKAQSSTCFPLVFGFASPDLGLPAGRGLEVHPIA